MGLPLERERKTVEPVAARLAARQSPADASVPPPLGGRGPWSDEELLAQVRRSVFPTIEQQGEVFAWIVDDTGFPKKGRHSVGVPRPYSGQVGKLENCRGPVSLSVATSQASLPIAWRLY